MLQKCIKRICGQAYSNIILLFQSAEKLKSINESVSAFRPRGNLPPMATRRSSSKRLSFENMEDTSQSWDDSLRFRFLYFNVCWIIVQGMMVNKCHVSDLNIIM